MIFLFVIMMTKITVIAAKPKPGLLLQAGKKWNVDF